MNVAFNFSNAYDQVVHAADAIRKQSSAEERVCLLFHMSVFTLHTYIFCERKKLNKSWQFDFLFLKVILSLLSLALKSW